MPAPRPAPAGALAAAALAPDLAAARAAAAGTCVENGTGERPLLAIEAAGEGLRRTAGLGPGEVPCAPAAGPVVLTALAGTSSVEGCPRLSGPGGGDRLIAFLPVDSCRRALHGP